MIALVHVRTWQVAYAHAFPSERLRDISVEVRAERWQQLLAEQPVSEQTLVAELGGEIVGFASTGPAREDPDRGELFAIYVLPDAWGSGAGRALMAGALAHLVESRFGDALLWVLEDNPRARRFYERAGWNTDGLTKVETVLGTDVPHVRYVTPLREVSDHVAAE